MTQCNVDGCEKATHTRPSRSRGMCPMHFALASGFGTPGGPQVQRFRGWAWEDKFPYMVEKTPEGWFWTRGRDGDGYGNFDRDGVKVGAHRVAWELWVGPIPDGMELDHVRALCSDRHCVKVLADEFGPAHLELVDHRTNVLRGHGWAGNHARSTHCPRGHEYDMVTSAGGRWCRTCTRDASREHMRKRRAQERHVETS